MRFSIDNNLFYRPEKSWFSYAYIQWGIYIDLRYVYSKIRLQRTRL